MLRSALSSSAHVSVQDFFQIPPAAGGGQLEGRWEHVLPASAVENDVMQGALQDPQHINVTNYGIANYQELSGVGEVYIHELASPCADTSCDASIIQFRTHIPMSDLVKSFESAKMPSSTCAPTYLSWISPNRTVLLQENQGNDRVGRAPQSIVPGSTQATLPGPSAHRGPVLSQAAAENLRRLASRCVHHPDSQVDVVRMEPGTAGRYKVVMILEMTDFL